MWDCGDCVGVVYSFMDAGMLCRTACTSAAGAAAAGRAWPEFASRAYPSEAHELVWKAVPALDDEAACRWVRKRLLSGWKPSTADAIAWYRLQSKVRQVATQGNVGVPSKSGPVRWFVRLADRNRTLYESILPTGGGSDYVSIDMTSCSFDAAHWPRMRDICFSLMRQQLGFDGACAVVHDLSLTVVAVANDTAVARLAVPLTGRRLVLDATADEADVEIAFDYKPLDGPAPLVVGGRLDCRMAADCGGHYCFGFCEVHLSFAVAGLDACFTPVKVKDLDLYFRDLPWVAS